MKVRQTHLMASVASDLPSMAKNPKERGVVLAISLMALVILTIIGITAMKGSVLEMRMAGNLQDATSAFQSAENGIWQALSTTGNLSLTGTSTDSFDYWDGTVIRGSAAVATEFIDFGKPARASSASEINSTVNSKMANFEITSTGTTTTGARSIIHQGVNQRLATTE